MPASRAMNHGQTWKTDRQRYTQNHAQDAILTSFGRGMNQVLIGRWKEAIDRNKSRLSAEDRLIIESLRTPEALLEDLQKRYNEAQSTWLHQINNQLKPFLSCLHSISTMFVVAMLPQSIETSLAWGVLSIILRVSWMAPWHHTTYM